MSSSKTTGNNVEPSIASKHCDEPFPHIKEFRDVINEHVDPQNSSMVTEHVGQLINEIITTKPTVKSVKEVVGSRLIIQGRIFDKKPIISQLVDSGASVDSVSMILLKRLGLTDMMVPLKKSTYANSFGGSKHEILGIIELTLKYGSEVYSAPFVVFENLASYDIILGVPFHTKYGLMKDTQTKLCNAFGNGTVHEEGKN